MSIQQLTEKVKKEFEDKIPERILNEDNPQYVLGWNACRYNALKIFESSLKLTWEEAIKEVENKVEICLKYCEKQNGLPYCKNCGLNRKMINPKNQ